MKTLCILLRGKNTGFFENDNNEYCQIKINEQKIKIVFSKGLGEISERGIVVTKSEKKALRIIKEDGFVLID